MVERMTFSLDVTPCILVDRIVLEEHVASFFRVEQNVCLTMKMEVPYCSETLLAT